MPRHRAGLPSGRYPLGQRRVSDVSMVEPDANNAAPRKQPRTLDSETQDLIDALSRLEAHARQTLDALTKGRGDERLSIPDGQPLPMTYRDVAGQLVAAHLGCAYFRRTQPLANEIVQLRADLHYLFSQCKEAYKRHGEARCFRMLEALPPPQDPEVDRKARALIKQMLVPRGALSPFEVADRLTLFIINKRHGEARRGRRVTENYVTELASLETTREACGPSAEFKSRVDLCLAPPGMVGKVHPENREKSEGLAAEALPGSAANGPTQRRQTSSNRSTSLPRSPPSARRHPRRDRA